jgi:hypothetical protein
MYILIKVKDEEALRLQEERRRQNSATSTETKLRGSTASILIPTLLLLIHQCSQMAHTDATISKIAVKRTRDLTEKEKEQKEIRLQVNKPIVEN